MTIWRFVGGGRCFFILYFSPIKTAGGKIIFYFIYIPWTQISLTYTTPCIHKSCIVDPATSWVFATTSHQGVNSLLTLQAMCFQNVCIQISSQWHKSSKPCLLHWVHFDYFRIFKVAFHWSSTLLIGQSVSYYKIHDGQWTRR